MYIFLMNLFALYLSKKLFKLPHNCIYKRGKKVQAALSQYQKKIDQDNVNIFCPFGIKQIISSSLFLFFVIIFVLMTKTYLALILKNIENTKNTFKNKQISDTQNNVFKFLKNVFNNNF